MTGDDDTADFFSDSPEELLKTIHRMSTWASQYDAAAADVSALKAALNERAAQMELALLEGREELVRAVDAGVKLSHIYTHGPEDFTKKCHNFRPRQALLRRFGVRSETG